MTMPCPKSCCSVHQAVINFYLMSVLSLPLLCRYIRSERSIILVNFCLSILASNLLILVGQSQTLSKVKQRDAQIKWKEFSYGILSHNSYYCSHAHNIFLKAQCRSAHYSLSVDLKVAADTFWRTALSSLTKQCCAVWWSVLIKMRRAAKPC